MSSVLEPVAHLFCRLQALGEVSILGVLDGSSQYWLPIEVESCIMSKLSRLFVGDEPRSEMKNFS